MNCELYLKLSGMMFLEFAVWGAWMPVLAARLLGPLKMSGKQTGWIYATLPLACMISPLFVGQLADKWFDAGWVLTIAHLIGAVLLFLAARQKKFGPLFIVMLLYSLCYAATIPLVNAVMFRHLTNADDQSPMIFIWAPVAWALSGYFLTGIRHLAKKQGDGSDCLYLAAVLSIAMSAICIFQPATPPVAKAGQPIIAALAMLKNMDYLIFVLVSLCVGGSMQFYFLGTSRFMQDMGISDKYIPGAMAMAQAAQALATLFALGLFLKELGPKWTLVVGAFCWFLLYVIYEIGRPRLFIVAGQVMHGLAYVFFIIAGQVYARIAAPPEIIGSAQSLIILATTGVGLFLGTQLAGTIMERHSINGKFLWPKIWAVPLAITLAGTLVLALLFHGVH
ncbi:MAG: MFS transporter [Thermoguttaceae bacterium]